jgi:hypothetical protein
MTISYPKELTLAHWKTKKSRLVAASDLEALLVGLERQHKGIDQSQLCAAGYRQLDKLQSLEQAAEKASQLISRVVYPHEKSLKKTQELAQKTAERLKRAKTVPKSDINLVEAIENACESQLKAWADPAQNGRQSFDKQRKVLQAALGSLQSKLNSEMNDLVVAIRATKATPTIPYWIVGKDPRLDAKVIGDRCIEAICKRIGRLIEREPEFQTDIKLFEKFTDDYPRKHKRIRVADPRQKNESPNAYEQAFKSEQAGITSCLDDLVRAVNELKKSTLKKK